MSDWNNRIKSIGKAACLLTFLLLPRGAFAVDGDGDGLPDEWETVWFGSLSQGAGDDPDGDGLTNLDEKDVLQALDWLSKQERVELLPNGKVVSVMLVF